MKFDCVAACRVRGGSGGRGVLALQTACCALRARMEETIKTMPHALLLACSAFATERAAMWAELETEVGEAVAAAVRNMPADRQLTAMLGDAQW